MHIADFDYDLPEELIAQEPLARRDASRMLIVDRKSQSWQDSEFSALPQLLDERDALILNNTRVFPARLQGKRMPSGGAVELLLLRRIEPNVWEALARPARRLQKGARIEFGESQLRAEVINSMDNGLRLIKFESEQRFDDIVENLGNTPLPPYIKREKHSSKDDRERYQTIYASQRGAIAAPTAGLHFTKKVLKDLETRGIKVAEITLHVGYGTFEPVRVDDVEQHRVAREWFSVTAEAERAINQARIGRGRAVAVGTTTTRALEASVDSDGRVCTRQGWAEITIVPGYRFRAVDALLTNFHLPRSSLLMLVSAFAGPDLVLAAYRHAVAESYRFYSYGDCMLIF
jgi:S-adenosylmethionine:tRNA ribosyltransferase-isomerase